MRDIGMNARLESELAASSEDVIKTSAIEGEVLNPASVRSSIARRLGLLEGGQTGTDRKVEGVVNMILDATKNHARPLTAERIFGWHAALFPTGYSGKDKIDIAQWRTDHDGAMQVVCNIGLRIVIQHGLGYGCLAASAACLAHSHLPLAARRDLTPVQPRSRPPAPNRDTEWEFFIEQPANPSAGVRL